MRFSVIPAHRLTQAPRQMVATAENFVESHISRDWAVVEKDIDVGSISCRFRIVPVSATKIVTAKRGELVGNRQSQFWFQVAAVGASRIDLTTADFVPFGIAIIRASKRATAFGLGGGQDDEADALSD